VEGNSAPQIAAHYRGISDDAVRRHAAGHLPATLAAAATQKSLASSADTLRQLERCLERVNLLFDACDRWLRDPEDSTRYEIGPRAEDIRVTYEERGDNGKATRRKARLSELLKRVAGEAPDVQLVETKHADPRELILHTAKRLEGLSELLARIVGQLKDPTVLNITVTAEWIAIRGVILQALDPYPAARVAVAAALESHAGH
jgi:hypothetical protein